MCFNNTWAFRFACFYGKGIFWIRWQWKDQIKARETKDYMSEAREVRDMPLVWSENHFHIIKSRIRVHIWDKTTLREEILAGRNFGE